MPENEEKEEIFVNKEEITAHVLLAKNGDTASFTKLYELYYKDMYRYAYYMLGGGEDVEDVISETVLDAFTGIKNLKHPSKFKAWIFQILTTKCKRQIAAYIGDREHKIDEPNENQLKEEDNPYEISLDVRNAFAALSELERTVVSLLVFGGYNSKEVAKLLKSRDGTIRSIKSRAFDKMAGYLTEY